MPPPRWLVALVAAGLCSPSARAAGLEDVIGYDEGLTVRSRDDRFALNLGWRLQYRLSIPFDGDPGSVADIGSDDPELAMSVRRARIRLGGHVGWTWLRYAVQVDWSGKPRLRDGRLEIGDDRFQVWVGQFKAGFGRERLCSSGAQQFAERSLSNAVFTIDRQIGVEAKWQDPDGSRLGASLGVYAGNGVLSLGRDRHPMLAARVQWHPQGEIERIETSDLDFTETPVSTFTAGVAWTRGTHTVFSSLGGGQLHGFEEGAADRYVLVQGLLDGSVVWRGFSAQGEAALKSVTDTEDERQTTLAGGYAQVGWLPHGLFPAFPAPFEIAVRGSWVDPDVTEAGDALAELTIGANAYLEGHRKKVTADLSRLSGKGADAWRGRLQLEFSF